MKHILTYKSYALSSAYTVSRGNQVPFAELQRQLDGGYIAEFYSSADCSADELRDIATALDSLNALWNEEPEGLENE